MDLDDLMRDISNGFDYWVEHATEKIMDSEIDPIYLDPAGPWERFRESVAKDVVSKEDVSLVMKSIISGVIHSVMVSLDGGGEMGGKGRLYLCDENGKVLSLDLHDAFMAYLLETGRIE